MAAPNVDIALVVDTSDSMRHCFDQLRLHLGSLLKPMQGSVGKVRYGLVGASASKTSGGTVNRVTFLCGDWTKVSKLYGRDRDDAGLRDEFFTDKPEEFQAALSRLVPSGDEDMLLALDIASDLPFGPVATTKRVIALFSDEPFEAGVSGSDSNQHIPALRKKLMARRVQLFAAIPEGEGAYELSQTSRTHVEFFEGGGGLQSVDFSQLLMQMGKSISASSIQSTEEPPLQGALFGQDRWVPDNSWSNADGG